MYSNDSMNLHKNVSMRQCSNYLLYFIHGAFKILDFYIWPHEKKIHKYSSNVYCLKKLLFKYLFPDFDELVSLNCELLVYFIIKIKMFLPEYMYMYVWVNKFKFAEYIH